MMKNLQNYQEGLNISRVSAIRIIQSLKKMK